MTSTFGHSGQKRGVVLVEGEYRFKGSRNLSSSFYLFTLLYLSFQYFSLKTQFILVLLYLVFITFMMHLVIYFLLALVFFIASYACWTCN